jgi:hypothetical protein
VLSSEILQWAIGLFVTILIAVATLFVPWLLQRRRKNLWYRISSYPLVERRRKDERIEILFDGESVPDVYISVIGLWYRGTSAIVEDDYRTPVTVDYGDSQILDAEMLEPSPEGVPAELSVEDSQRVIFAPAALNDDNVMRARVLLTSRQRPKITGHIVDVKLRNYREHRTFGDVMVRVTFAIVGIGLALFIIGTILALLLSSGDKIPLGVAFAIFGGLALVMAGVLLIIPFSILSFRAIDKSPI